MRNQGQWLLRVLAFAGVAGTAAVGFADGNEELGSIAVNPGSAIISAGVGTRDVQPGTISLDIPAGVSIEQVLLYWQIREDASISLAGDDTIIVETATFPATEITGDLIGMAEVANGNVLPTFGYRADITALGIISAGVTNLVDVSGMVATFKTPGAAIVAIINDGTTSGIQDFRDGIDFAFAGFSGNAAVLAPQVYNFAPLAHARNAKLVLMFGDAEDHRPDVIDLTVGGVTSTFCNEARSSVGPEWDIVRLEFVIPAGVDSVELEAFSADCGALPGLPDSLTWMLAALAIQGPEAAIDVRKEAEGPDTRTFVRGSDVTFEIVVTNTGDVDLTNVIVTDTLAPDCDRDIGDLAAGDSVSYTCTAQNVMNSFDNEVCADGESNGLMFGDCDPSTVEIIDIDIRKNAEGDDTQMVESGADATFEIVVTNTGDEDLTNVVVTDFLAPDCDRDIGDLAAGASVTYSCVSPGVIADFDNVACVDGERNGVEVTDCDPSTVVVPPVPPAEGCRVTGGGVDQQEVWDGSMCNGRHGSDRFTFGGQAGAPTGALPQPFGEWTHHQKNGPSGRFVFHGGTASASPETEIALIECGDPGFCNPARPAPAKQIRFEGIGEFQNIHHNTEIPGAVERETLHFFCVRINDAGEPGGGPGNGNHHGPNHNSGNGGGNQLGGNINGDCPADGFDVFSDPTSLVNCDCDDFYEIKIFATATPAPGEEPIYHVFGNPNGGNLQIHPALD